MHPELRHQRGLAARDMVLTQLSPAIEQRYWQHLYQQVLGTTVNPVLSVV